MVFKIRDLLILIAAAILISACATDVDQDPAPDDTPQPEDTPAPVTPLPGEPATTVQLGDVVSVEYNGTFPNGTRFDSSEGREPLVVQIGAGQVIPGFEAALLGLDLNERTTVEIPPEQAYGLYNEAYIQSVSVEDFGIDPTEFVGEYINVVDENGFPLRALLIGVEDGMVMLDLNHPLADETLVFDIEVVDIER